MRARALLAAVLVVAIAAPACTRGDDDDDAFVLRLDGRAEVEQADGGSSFDGGEHRLAAGDVVRVVDGDAVLELPGEPSVLLRAGRNGRDDSVVRVATRPEIIDGDAVVVAAGDELQFDAGGVEVALRGGAARVQRALGVTVALYDGAAEVSSAGRVLSGGLAALRQVSVPATGLLPRQPSPLLYDDAEPDPWDRAFLGDAIDLGEELERRARGFTGQLGPRVAVDALLLRRVLPPLAEEDDFGEPLLRGAARTPGEVLVGGAIAVEADGRSFRERWDDVFAFRDDGARWGLVALDQQVQRDALLGTITDAFGRSPLLFAAQGPAGDDVAVGPPPNSPRETTTTTTRPDDGGGDDPEPPNPPPSVPPTTVPPPLTIPPLPIPLDPDDPDDGPGGSNAEPALADVVWEVVDDLVGDDSLLAP